MELVFLPAVFTPFVWNMVTYTSSCKLPTPNILLCAQDFWLCLLLGLKP